MNRIGKIMRKENGSTLVVALLVIAVFSVLGLTLIGVSLAHSQQISQSTSKIQATNAAEMGLKAYDQKIKAALNAINGSHPNSFSDMENKVSELVTDQTLPDDLKSGSDISLLQGNPQFEVTMAKEAESGSNKITLSLTSTGRVQGNQRKISQDQILIFNPLAVNTPVYNGLSLPYMNGSVIVSPGNWDCKPHNNNNIFINGSSENCVGATEQSVDLSGINAVFQKMPMATSTDTMASADQNGDLNIPSPVNGDLYIVGGSKTINIPANTTFNGNVYISGNVNIGANVDFKGNVYVRGDATSQGNVQLEGNALIAGNLDFSGNDVYEGYVFIGGNITRGSDNNPEDSIVDFQRTVYVQGDLDTKSNKAEIKFEQGIVIKGKAEPKTSANGRITIGPQQRGSGDGTSEPVSVSISNTMYH
jgi:hypothetical protein